jgi:soluble lytic murein transglycosylase-like protein
MRSAATQQPAPKHLKGLVDLLSTLPPVLHPGRSEMKPNSPTTVPAPSPASRAYATARSAFALIGLAGVAAFALAIWQREPLARAFPLGDPFSVPALTAEGAIKTHAVESPLEREQRAVTEFISKRYRVADAAVAGFVASAYRAGEQQRVDPLLILAVMAVESRFNPVAESVMGAKGLMQIIPKFHLDKLLDHGGEPALLEPEVNIAVGAQILREYQRRFGDVETALQMYSGAFDEPTSQYASKVLAEKAKLDALRWKARKQQTAQAV